MPELTVTIHFLEPFRVFEHHAKEKRNSARFMRGYSYARWHGKDEAGRPYITGTLVRSAFLKSIEQILWMKGGVYEDEECCPGLFKGSGAKVFHDKDKKLKAGRLRRRQTLQWQNGRGICPDNAESPCLHCLLLGRFDTAKAGNKSKDEFDVKFFNFDAFKKKDDVKINIRQLAQERVINRVDQESGKAEDFVKIWEIDHKKCGTFTGKIRLSKRADNDRMKALIKDAAALTDRIAGALCRIEINGANPEKKCEFCDAPDETGGLFSGLAGEIAAAFEEAGKTVHLRMFADVIRSMRRKDETALENLPKGHSDSLGKVSDHFIWDSIKIGKTKLRDWLPKQFEESELKWRDFCEQFGQALYDAAKKAAPEQFSSQRPLGAAEGIHISADPETELPKGAVKNELHEILITGELVAQTPFFFGWSRGDDKGDHTNMRLLASKDGSLRLPRSVLRGILRRDLKIAFGTGCRAELGHNSPCSCPVCQLMRQVTLKDSCSEYKEPPRIRHRIRLNPSSGTVADGALFDMETGPTGVKFPFELRIRSEKNEIPGELQTVLSWWREGKVFFSGSAGTGKGRFELTDLKQEAWDLKKDLKEYANIFGGRNKDEFKASGACSLKMSDEYPWKKWDEKGVEFSVSTPFLTRDPIAALLDQQGNDAVCYKAVETKEDGITEKEIYLLKSESFRGMLRTAVARRNFKEEKVEENGKAVMKKIPLLDAKHEDCQCLLCKIFGNEHNAGNVRVEDLRIENDNGEKHIDRVAIDRFTGGAKDKHKFDMRPLSATPNNRLTFSGTIWVSDKLSRDEKAKQALRDALADIENGLYSFGGLGNIGLGWVDYDPVGDKNETASFEVLNLAENFKKPELEAGKIYWPHYFLPFEPEAKVWRKKNPPSHAHLDEKRYTGKLVCTLTTKTPLIIPDGIAPGNEEAHTDEKGHKTYDFFNLNGEICIPGSEIRGLVSSVYEALTNSCLRVFDDKKRLSWRMEADKGNQEIFKPGLVLSDGNGGFTIEEMDEVRYPFYDNYKCPDKSSQEKYFAWGNKLEFTDAALNALEKENISGSSIAKLKNLVGRKYKNGKSFISAVKDLIGKNDTETFGPLILKYAEKYDKEVPYYNHPTPTDKRLLSLLNGNRTLMKRDGADQYAVIKHRPDPEAEESFMFVATPADNKQGYKQEEILEVRTGYLKVTGANKVEKEKIFTPGLPPVPQDMNRLWHNVMPSLKEITVRCGEKQDRDCKRKRLVPEYLCSEKDKDNPEKGYTYSMTKRCERVFLKKARDPQKKDKAPQTFPVDPSAIEKFKILVKEYQKNAEQYKTPEAFRTLLPKDGTINKNDLIYFRSEVVGENEKVVEIIPVRISRKVDDLLMGERLPNNADRRPCVREILDENDAKNVKQAGLKPLYQHHPDGLCPGCALFGTGFYKSRVSFGFAFSKNGAKLQKDVNGSEYITLPLLERPRPTWSMPKPETDEKEKVETKVPGRKFYVHHQGWKKVVEKSEEDEEGKSKTKNNRTVQALAPKQKFRFEVRFENLRDWELGLLIHSLQLEKGMAHKLGMAKAFGFGSVDIRVDGVDCGGVDAVELDNAVREKLRTFWGGDTDTDVSKSLDTMFSLMTYIKDEKVNVRYPALKKENENDPPGYEELKKEKFKKEERREKLTAPWSPWHKNTEKKGRSS